MPLSCTENRHDPPKVAAEMWMRGRIFVAIFERVADEVLKHLLQMGGAHVHGRQRVEGNGCIALSDSFRQAS